MEIAGLKEKLKCIFNSRQLENAASATLYVCVCVCVCMASQTFGLLLAIVYTFWLFSAAARCRHKLVWALY